MIQIRPVSDLRNKFPEIEKLIDNGQPVFLTKNGNGSMVVLSLQQYSEILENREEIEQKLDEADESAANDSTRLTHEEVFTNVRKRLSEYGV